MKSFHQGLEKVGGEKVIRTEDYSLGLNGMPKSDVLKFFTNNGSVVIRLSGTEPKIKAYISVICSDEREAKVIEKRGVFPMKAIKDKSVSIFANMSL